ncbi:hypothetical protein MCETHM1_01619 [Flavobacteriaceae bacterium]
MFKEKYTQTFSYFTGGTEGFDLFFIFKLMSLLL